MIGITGIGNGICLWRNLITHFLTVNHRAANAGCERSTPCHATAAPRHQSAPSVSAPAKTRHPPPVHKPLETSTFLHVRRNAPVHATDSMQTGSQQQEHPTNRQLLLTATDRTIALPQRVCAKLRKPLQAGVALKSRSHDASYKRQRPPRGGRCSTSCDVLSVRLLPASRHTHRPKAALPGQRHLPARSRTANPHRRHLR